LTESPHRRAWRRKLEIRNCKLETGNLKSRTRRSKSEKRKAKSGRAKPAARALRPGTATGTGAKTLPLLLEVGCEEIPARFLTQAERDLGERLARALRAARLLPAATTPQASDSPTPDSGLRTFSTPRRLVVHVPAIFERQPDTAEEVLGPPVRVAFDAEGKPTRAATSFAEKSGVPVEKLLKLTTPKGEYLAVRRTTPGEPASRLLPGILRDAVLGISFPKSMTWEGKAGPRFIRPIRWLVALVGEGPKARVVPVEIGGVVAAAFTWGHRALARGPVRVTGLADYERKLRRMFVEFDPENRRQMLRAESEVLLEDWLRIVEDQSLETWHVNSCEWPSAVRGGFDERFLRLPREILITVMKDHQKYFAVEDEDGKLHPLFIAILNTERDELGFIRQGHERVLTARFTDAEFFWQADQRQPLAARREVLGRVTYQAELGSYADKVGRMRAIAEAVIAALRQARQMDDVAAGHALRAVELSKCDLTTQMVGEFPELQGVVGGLYARVQGEPAEVAEAIYDHYRPEGLEDSGPRSLAGAVVSLADKLDSVAGGFAVGREPSGSSDPFALRRAGNGAVKVMVEFSMSLALTPLIERALDSLDVKWRKPREEVRKAVFEFLGERLRYYLESARKLRPDTVRAALGGGWEVPLEAARRAEALEAIRDTADFVALAAAAKRIKNILAKSASADDWKPGKVDAGLLDLEPERQLHQSFVSVAEEARNLAESGDYRRALERIATLRPAVDLFFDKVLVMAEDRRVRENRLRLLGGLDGLLSGIARFSEIGGIGEKI
jgi:glycyl-tRNA synthetase beta chain